MGQLCQSAGVVVAALQQQPQLTGEAAPSAIFTHSTQQQLLICGRCDWCCGPTLSGSWTQSTKVVQNHHGLPGTMELESILKMGVVNGIGEISGLIMGSVMERFLWWLRGLVLRPLQCCSVHGAREQYEQY